MQIDPAKLNLAAEFPHDTPLMSCAFDADGRFLFAGGRGRNVLAIDLTSNRKCLLDGHESWIGIMTRAGESILTADFAGRVIAWDCSGEEPQPRWNIEAHPSTIYGLSVAADGKTFATGDRDGTVRVWQTASGTCLHALPQIDYPVYCVALHPDGMRIVTADRRPQKPRVTVWDLISGNEELIVDVAELSGYRRVEDIEWGGIRALSLSPDGAYIVACGREGYDGQACAMIYEIQSGKLLRKLALALKGGFYYSAKFHPQGFLLTGGGDIAKGEFRCWNLSQNESIANISTSGPCFGIDVHPRGARLAVAQAVGKKSVPESGLVAIYEWSA